MAEKIELGKTFYSWHFPEFEKQVRSSAWYISVAVLTLIFLFLAFLDNNFLFAVIIVMAVVIIFLQSGKEPQDLKIEITEGGVKIEDKIYPYKDINKFFIIYEPPQISNLYLDLKSNLKPRVTIPLMNQNPVNIRDTLLLFLDEDVEKNDEPASDYLTRVLKL